MRRVLYGAEHEDFRSGFRSFLVKEALPHTAAWEAQGIVDRTFWLAAGAAGYLGFEASEALGGMGIRDFRFNAVMSEELVALGIAGDGFSMHNDILAPYLLELCTTEQQARWLPAFTSGEMVAAIAMTEPGAGSDLAGIRTTAHRDGDSWVIDGSKAFITNGSQADLVLVLARTGERDGRGMSLIAVEAGAPGLERGRPLAKIGRHGQDTAELFFSACRVPVNNVIGQPGDGFATVMANLPRERLSIAVLAVASAVAALRLALQHCHERTAFGQAIGQLQTAKHALAEMHTEVQVAQQYVDRCVAELNAGQLSAADAAGAKFFTTELQWRVVDRCLQLFGGYGYMEEFAIARIWRDARVQRIYGGTTEIMKEVVGRELMA
ncbi:MAG: acyl-CoA dehydrogenase domain protein [Frankiales bacterium]|nr:acyl-CoA dehydrogenase domain protein [Frankiales bacterium]